MAASKKIFEFVSLDILNKAKTMSHKKERFTQFTCGAKRLFYKSSKCVCFFKLALLQSRLCRAWMQTNLLRLAPNHTTGWLPVTWFVTWFMIRTPTVLWKCCKQKWKALLQCMINKPPSPQPGKKLTLHFYPSVCFLIVFRLKLFENNQSLIFLLAVPASSCKQQYEKYK